MAAHQAPLSLGFSRQEHWSGLPFPSPMHESEKWKWNCSVMSDSSDPMDCSPPGSCVHGILQARVLEWFAMASPRRYSQPRDWTKVSCICRGILYHWTIREALMPMSGWYENRFPFYFLSSMEGAHPASFWVELGIGSWNEKQEQNKYLSYQ